MNTRDEFENILRSVCRAMGLRIKDVMKSGREYENVAARQISMYIIRETFGNNITFETVGKFFRKDTATVQHAVKATREHIDVKDSFICQSYHKSMDILRNTPLMLRGIDFEFINSSATTFR